MMDFRPLWPPAENRFCGCGACRRGGRNVVKEDEHPLRRDLIKVRGSLDRDAGGVHLKVSGFMSRRRWPSKSTCAVRALKRSLKTLTCRRAASGSRDMNPVLGRVFSYSRTWIAEVRNQPVIGWL